MKIIKAREVPDIDDNGEVVGTDLVVTVDIDGTQTVIGGINPRLSKQELLAHLESRREEIIANSREQSKCKTINRDDLL